MCGRDATWTRDEYIATMYTYNFAQRQRNPGFFEEVRLTALTTQRNRILEGKQDKNIFKIFPWEKHTA